MNSRQVTHTHTHTVSYEEGKVQELERMKHLIYVPTKEYFNNNNNNIIVLAHNTIT